MLHEEVGTLLLSIVILSSVVVCRLNVDDSYNLLLFVLQIKTKKKGAKMIQLL